MFYKIRSNQVSDSIDYRRVTLDSTFQEFKNEVAELSRDNGSVLVSDINYEVIAKNRKLINDSLTDAYFGIPAARDVVIGLARNYVEKKFPDKKSIRDMIDFEDYEFLDAIWIWEILIYKLMKKHDKYVIQYLEETYHISELKHKVIYKWVNGEKVIDREYNIREFDATDLRNIFFKEVALQRNEEGDILSYVECVDILAKYYQSVLIGLEMMDTIEQLKVDGFNLGASGSIRYTIDGKTNVPYRNTNSLWIQIDAKWVMFSFIDFKTVEKMRKIENQLVAYGTAPPMTESNPSKVTDGVDGSRRVSIRPGAGESWFYSQRNFITGGLRLRSLLEKPYVKNCELPIKLIEFLMKAEQTTAFTGPQNTGKTTLMKGAFEAIEDKNIRVLEMSFELALRELYPWKNTFTVKPTDYISSANLQDLLKKTDSWVSGVGEVAEDIVAARMIQFCLIASAFTIFSHHGLNDTDLVMGLANSLVASGEYHDHNVAISTVLSVIHNNVHLTFTENKERVVEYISQIIKLDELEPYPEITKLLDEAKVILNNTTKSDDVKASQLAQVMLAYTMLTREYYTRTTDRVRFESRKIIVYDPDTKSYQTNEWYTDEQMKEMLYKLNEKDREEFIKFYVDNWIDKKYLREGSY